MLSAAARRLPGIRFEPRAAQLDEALPRMDVAAFVGFAASGPLHTPVAVEDAAEFRAIFGDSAALAWDPLRGEFARTLLASAVNSFFANGGRRCWIVRVAGDAAACNYFPLPGVAALRPAESGRPPRMFPAFARARSRGSWSDGLRVSAAFRFRPIQVAAPYGGGEHLFLSGASPIPSKGDLLRLVFDDGEFLLFAAADPQSQPVASPPAASAVEIRLTHRVWLAPSTAVSPPGGLFETEAKVYTTLESKPPVAGAIAPGAESRRHPFERAVRALVDGDSLQPSETSGNIVGEIAVSLLIPPGEAPAPGSLVTLELPGQQVWLVVARLGYGEAQLSPPGRMVTISGPAWRLAQAPAAPRQLTQADIVTMDLRVQEGERSVHTLHDLGLAPSHPRYWNAIVSDDTYYRRDARTLRDAGDTDEAERFELGVEPGQPGGATSQTRFPLAGAEDVGTVFVPLALASGFDRPLPAVHQPRSALERDGLDKVDEGLFLDREMAVPGVDQFMATADAIRYLAPAPRPLTGLHAILGFGESAIIEEGTMIAIPDAVHPPWRRAPSPPLPAAGSLPPIVRPEWWRWLPCDQEQVLPAAEKPPADRFLDCDIRLVAEPLLEAPERADATGTFTLRWSAPEGTHFVLEESVLADFAGAQVVYEGPATERTLYSRSHGDYFYRARVLVGRNTSNWSSPRAVRVGIDAGWELEPVQRYRDDTLIAVHRALLRMCAGRGDLIGVLSLPAHYREREAIAHAARLRTFLEDEPRPQAVRPLDREEANALTYGALYHPWLIERRPDGTLGEIPPDGAACGVLALRAAARGAWIAPANEPLQGAVALTPPIPREARRPLQEAQVNLVRQEPHGMLVLSEDTLSLDFDLRPINVRRLLILLRRLALRRGMTFIFEPLSDAFRRLVQREFEQTLYFLFQQGAFAGRTPASAYQVVTAAPVNTPRSLDQGHFFVELKVAPSLPMTFLTVRLVQAGDRLTATEGR